jgi:hypothetical protein
MRSSVIRGTIIKLPIPLTTRPQVWKGGKMYSLEEDAEGVQRVKRYNASRRIRKD